MSKHGTPQQIGDELGVNFIIIKRTIGRFLQTTIWFKVGGKWFRYVIYSGFVLAAIAFFVF